MPMAQGLPEPRDFLDDAGREIRKDLRDQLTAGPGAVVGKPALLRPHCHARVNSSVQVPGLDRRVQLPVVFLSRVPRRNTHGRSNAVDRIACPTSVARDALLHPRADFFDYPSAEFF